MRFVDPGRIRLVPRMRRRSGGGSWIPTVVGVRVGLPPPRQSFLRWWLVIVVGIGLLCCGSVAEGLRMRSRWTVGRVAVGRMVKASGGGRVAAGDRRRVR